MSFRRLSLAVLLALAAEARSAAPEILSIEPASAPTAGGFPVVILGRNLDLPPDFACIVPCPPRVRFGDAETVAREHTNERLVVLAPAHPAGVVDVTVTTGDMRTVTREDAFTFTPSPEEAWEKVLVPIYFEKTLPGGAGSLWETQFRLRNGASLPVEIAPLWCDLPCPPVYPSRSSLRPGETLAQLPPVSPGGSEGRGRIFFLTRELADQVSVQARIADVSRGRADAGTEIPILRSGELQSGPLQLLNVPFDPGSFRYRLRIYETTNVPTAFRVSVYDEAAKGSAEPLVQLVVETRSDDPQPEFRFEPFYYETDLGALLRPVFAAGTVRVEVLPLATHSRSWAMLTVTSVDGNHVTLVTPQ